MTPPSGLYSLAKVGALTFFGAFLGALTLSSVPTSLDGWKALVMPALGAAIAAELVFLRTAIAAALTGTTLTQTTSTVVTAPANDVVAPKSGQAGFATLRHIGGITLFALLGLIVMAPRGVSSKRTPGSAVVAAQGCAGGVPTPQTQAVIDASANLALCVEGVIQTDGAAVPPAPLAQVLVDEGVTCASEALALVTAIGQEANTNNMAAAVSKVHADVSAKRTGKVK